MSEFQEMSMTRWHNPTKHVIRAAIFVGADARNPSGRREVIWQPGDTKQVPSEYDQAIQETRNGRVVGGLAPQLVREGEPPLPLDPAIDSEAAERRSAGNAIAEAAALKAAADARLAEAAQAEQAVIAKQAAPATAPAPAEQPRQQQGQRDNRDGRDRR